MSSKSGSSRRKPQVVRKVFDTSDEEEGEEDGDQKQELKMNGKSVDDDVIMNGDTDEVEEVNGNGIPDELPEGTVVIEPEAVEDTDSPFKGPEFPTSKRKSDIGYLSIVTCTCCGKQINTNQPGEAKRHPALRVLVCRACHKFYKSGPITQDEDGLDEQCRWCSEGGKLFGCDFCNNTFCRSCIVRNLGRSELSVVQDEDSQWKCYICNPRPLSDLIENCNKVLDKIANDQEKEKQKQKLQESEKKQKLQESEKKKSSQQSNSKSESSKSSKGKEIKKESDSAKGEESKKDNTKSNSLGKTSEENKKPVSAVKSSLHSILTEPPKTLPLKQPQNQQNIVYVQAHPQINANSLFGSGLNTRNVHSVIDKLITVTSSLKLLLSSIRMNIQNEQDSQDFMLSGIVLQNRQRAVECVKSGVDLFLDELRQIDKGQYNINQSYSVIQNNVQNNVSNTVNSSSSMLAASLMGGPSQQFVNIAPKPQPPALNLDISKAISEMVGESKPEDVKPVAESSDVKEEPVNKESNTETKEDPTETKEEPVEIEKNTAENTNDSNSVETSKKEEKMDDDNDEGTSKKSPAEEEVGEEVVKSDGGSDDDDDSDSDDSDDESDESDDEGENSGDFEEEWSKKKNKKQKGKKEKESSSKKDKKKKDTKGKSKKSGRLSIRFKFGKKDNSVDEDQSDDNSDSETDKKGKKGDKKSKRSENSKGKKKSNDSDSEGEDKTDDNSDSETDKKGKKGDKKSKKSENSKGKKKSKDSDSEGFDSDLEDEIDKLSKDPSNSKKKKSAGENKTSEKKKKQDNKKEVEKDKKNGKKKSDKKTDSSSDDDDNDDDNNYDDDTEEEREDKEELPFDGNDENESEEENKDENVKAKEDLLKELENSTTEEENGSSDSEVVINSPKKKKTPQKKKSTKAKPAASDDTDSDISPPKRKKTRNSLLEAKISDSDSDFQTPKKKKGKKRKASTTEEESDQSDSDSGSDKKKGKKGKQAAKGKKGAQKGKQKGKKRRRIKEKSDSSDDEQNESDEEDGSDEESQTPGGMGKRKKIRKVKSDKKLTDATKEAVKAEEERRKRIEERQKQFNNIEQEVDESSPVKCPTTTKLVLEEDKETKKPIIEVDRGLIRQLKPHQVEAVQFVWDCTMETLERSKKEPGAGCLLAHCMGLGKTLTLVTFIHTMMVNQKKTKISRALVICPLNTVLNWQREFEMWQEHTKKEVEVFELASVKQNFERAQVLQNWHEDGGVMIMGYEMFRILSMGSLCRSKKQKQIFAETLLDPGPDLIVCDEGHILKNEAASVSKAVNKIRTRRRVVLTGTPLQNNLVEYHCMVNFVKPNLLGSMKEFRNRFVNPITNGQCADSTMHDVKIMKRRAHILHEKLAGCVQRKDYSALTKFLPPKHEYVISVRLTKVQVDLYRKYLSLAIGDVEKVSGKGGRIFQDYQNLMRIWTHPWVLKMDEVIKEQKAMFNDDDEFIDDSMSGSDSEGSASNKSSSSSDENEAIPVDSDDDKNKGRSTRSRRQTRQESKEEKESESNDSSSKDKQEEKKREIFAGEVVKRWTTRSRGGEDWEEMLKREKEEEENRPLTTEWWAEFVSKEDFNKIELSGKLTLLLEILRMCEEIGDKILVFSQSLLSLDLIEDFLDIVDKKHQEETQNKSDEELVDGQGFGKHWTKGEDYLRMDGSTGPQQRKDMAKSFNDPENYRARLFLISTKAGSLGINLVGANRVIIFDASWNPSHDVQSIFRVYRFGQTKPVYVYRFLAQATMEEKIYERQIIKLSLSQRVVDEHQIERHFTSQDLQELYNFKPDILDDPDRVEKPTPVLPKDHMLAELFKSHKDYIVTYHEHDSLLENKIEEELSEEERKAAWEDYEREGKGITLSTQNLLMNAGRYPVPGGMQMGYQNMPQMGGMRHPGMPPMPFDGQHLMQLVQEMKAKFPHLPQDQLTARVQGVIRSMLANQIMQQHDVQRRQMEQQELQHHNQLQQIQAQIRRQQQQMSLQSMQRNIGGMNLNQQPRFNQFGGMQQPRMGGGPTPVQLIRNSSPGQRVNLSGAGTSSNPINLDGGKPPGGKYGGNG